MSKENNEPIIVTKQQMIDYCFAQPDDREVNFSGSCRSDPCGCVMVQYGIDNGIEFDGCGISSWVSGNKDTAVFEYGVVYRAFRPCGICTYGEIKKHLREQGWKPTEELQDA